MESIKEDLGRALLAIEEKQTEEVKVNERAQKVESVVQSVFNLADEVKELVKQVKFLQVIQKEAKQKRPKYIHIYYIGSVNRDKALLLARKSCELLVREQEKLADFYIKVCVVNGQEQHEWQGIRFEYG